MLTCNACAVFILFKLKIENNYFYCIRRPMNKFKAHYQRLLSKNDIKIISITGFVLLHLRLKTKNLAFNKNQFSTFVFAFDLKCSKPNNSLTLFRIKLRLKWWFSQELTSSQNFSTSTQVQNKSKIVSEALLQNVRRSFSIKSNPNNCEFDIMARRFNLIWKDPSFVSKVK